MTKKRLFSILASSMLTISPISIIVSCSAQNSFYDENGTNVIQGFKSKQIKVQINLGNEEEFKISQLSDVKFNFKVDESIIMENDEKSKELYKKLTNSLDKTKISFIDFYIPKFNEDKNSCVLFKVNKLDELVQVKIEDLIIKNKNNLNVPIIPLSEEEIKLLTINKLNKQIFIPDLTTKIESFFKNKFTFNNDDFNENWWNINKNNLNKELKYDVKKWFINAYLCFNESYDNIQISDFDLLFNKLENDTKIEVKFKISTSSLDVYPNCAYEITLTLWKSNICKI